MIPKIIHAIWFGGKDKNEVIQRCVKSWSAHMPDYHIMWWTEANVDIDLLPAFAQHAYKNKRWAYVADVVRLQKLHEYGGVYLDTDMLIIKDPTPLFNKSTYSPSPNLGEGPGERVDISVWGMEDETHISCGIIACNKNNNFIKKLYDFYSEHYKNNNMNVVIEVPKIVTKLSKDIPKDELIIYGAEYFYPLPATNKKEDYREFLTANSYAVHLWNYSWQTPFMRIMNQLQIVKISKAIIPKNLRPLIVNILRRLKLN